MLATYLPFGLRQELLSTPPAVPAGKTFVQETALLYADLAGFTPLTEAFAQAGPEGVEALAAVLNRVFGGLLDRLHAFGGDLIKFSGDALTCVWPRGADSAGEVLARALAAALAMQEQMQEHPGIETPAGHFPLSMRVGLALGRVITAIAGAETRRFFLVLGPALQRAARAQSRARPGGIALDARARAVLSTTVTCDRAGRLLRVQGPLPAPAAAAPPPPLPDELARPFLLPALVQRLQTTPGSFLAEFRRVVPLFVSFQPPGVRGLQRYVGRALPIIESYGGNLLEVESGDKGCLLVVLFGAPLSHEDDAAQAAACALALRDLPETRGMGITCGTLFTGSLGNAVRRQYSAIGDEMNVAARLMEAAGDAILLSRRVRRAAGERFLYGPAQQLTLKGKEDRVPAFALVGPRPRPGGEFAILPGELVGRQGEQAFLDEAISRVHAGRGAVLSIVGPAGIGKTCLAGELLRRWAARGGTGHWGAATAAARQQPYFPWSGLLRSLLALRGDAPDQADLRAALDALHPDLRLRLPLLADVLGWTMPDNEFTRHLDARQRQDATLALVAEIVRRRARESPLLLLLEDVHWMDRPSWDLALAVGRTIEDLPVLLCLVGRPEEEGAGAASPWSQMARLPHHRSLLLGELTAEEIVSLARRELRVDAISEEIGRLLVERSQGNPLFVQEIVRTLVEGGAITVEAGQACLGRSPEEMAIPDTIHGVVLSRLDRLDEPTKLTLKVAAVIGRTFSVPVLRGIHPTPPEEQELVRQLGLMERFPIVRIESSDPYPSYIFHHVITQEVAYSTLVSAQRSALHRRVAEWYEQTFAENLSPHYGLLAYHYERAGLEDRWVLYLGRMAEEAGRRYAPDVAIEAYGRLGAVLERWAAGDPSEQAGRVARMVDLDPSWGWDALPEKKAHFPPASPDERLFRARFRAALGLADTLDLRGRWEEEHSLLESLRPYVERAGDRTLAIAVGVRRAVLALNSGDLEAGLRLADEVLALARQEGDLSTQAYMRSGRSRAAEMRGEIEVARREARQALRLARRAQDSRSAGIALILLGNICNAVKQPARAARYFEQAVAAQRAAGDRSWEIVALNNLGITWIQSGMLDRARECLEQVLSQARLIGDLEVELMALGNLGAIDLRSGHYEQAGARLEYARALFRKMGRRDAEAEALEYLAEVALHQGEISQALAWASEARELRRACGLPLGGLLTYARILEEGGRRSEAREAYRSLSQMVEQSQAGRPSADALAGLARCALADGDRSDAQSLLEEALRLLAEGKARAEDAARIYLTGYRLFNALGLPEKARTCLSHGRRLLRRQAARIADPQMRESFLYNVPVHREILTAGEPSSGPARSRRSRR